MVPAAAAAAFVIVVVVAIESWLVNQSRAAGTKAQGQFRNTEEGEHPPLQTITRRTVRTLVMCVHLHMCTCILLAWCLLRQHKRTESWRLFDTHTVTGPLIHLASAEWCLHNEGQQVPPQVLTGKSTVWWVNLCTT
jgi:hypothetical protein